MRGERPVLELTGISKTFGPVQALRGADFSLAPGEVHALLGENGAGKSTLLRIAYGMIVPDAGRILVDARETPLGSPRAARELRIGMVHQHFTSIAGLTVSENIALAVGPSHSRTAREVSSPYPTLMTGLSGDLLVASLSVAGRQRLEIVKALATGARILLLDEPSAVLAPRDVDELLDLIRQFTAAGGAAALVTHKLREVFLAADRVTVLRRGSVTFSGPVEGQTEESLAQAMIGTGAKLEPVDTKRHPSPASLEPATVVAHFGGLPLHAAELVGVAAVEGNGQRELLRRLAVEVTGRFVAALVPEDRSTEGLIPDLSITENLVLGLETDARWARGGRLDWGRARQRATELMEEFGIRADGPDALVRTLSGGNQQKVVLARALTRRPAILVAENPTRGLDIRATAFVHAQLRAAARQGVLVVVYSTDLDEVLELGRRVLVVHAGRVSEVPAGADRRVVGEMMLGLQGAGSVTSEGKR